MIINSIIAGASGGGGPVLPSGFTAVNYIQTSGTQYISTNLVPKANDEIKLQYSNLNQQNYNSMVFGCAPYYVGASDVNNRFMQIFNGNKISATNEISYTNLNASNNEVAITYGECAKYDVEMNPSNIKVNGTIISNIGTSNITNNITDSISIGARGSVGNRPSSVRIYYLSVVRNNISMIELYPAVRDLDSVVGMYDVANGIFYTNAGTGTFTYG